MNNGILDDFIKFVDFFNHAMSNYNSWKDTGYLILLDTLDSFLNTSQILDIFPLKFCYLFDRNLNQMKLKKLDREVTSIYQDLLQRDPQAREIGELVHPGFKWSAINLMRYLTLRTHDLRKVHDTLSEYGVSSLRSAEGYTLRNVVDVLRLIKLLQGIGWKPRRGLKFVGYQKSKKLRHEHAAAIFNEADRKCSTEIMVTMPTEAAEDTSLVQDLLIEGMEIARINLSHDNPDIWGKIATNIRTKSEKLQIPCKILMDLGGPKIRTRNILVPRKGVIKSRERVKIYDGDHVLLIPQDVGGDLDTVETPEGAQEVIRLSINLPKILDDVEVGERIFFDDGKIGANIVRKGPGGVEIVVTSGAKDGCVLKVEKGINLPDTRLKLDSLTEDDLENLPFALQHADIIGYSFVRNSKDVEILHGLMGSQVNDKGIIYKIENQEAFQNLPLILLTAMKYPKVAVMIARGDLAVEIGAERMSEVQDEIMWICEAAHIPVVWATEVLDKLAKKGRPTRSEITDAASSVRAECVMLNKGPYIVEAVKMLKKILIKMEMHTSKKKSKMRPLKLAIETLRKMDKEPKKKE